MLEHAYGSEKDAVQALVLRLHRRYAKDDIRDIYRIIHLLLEILTEDGHYNYHYNKHLIIMNCLYTFYASYPNSREIIRSYSSYVSEKLHDQKHQENVRHHKKDRRSSFCSGCVLL